MTKAEVTAKILAEGGNEYIASVLTSEEFAKYFNANVAKGMSEKESLSTAFASCQQDTFNAVTRPEVIKYVAERTYREIRSAHGLTADHVCEFEENAILSFFN